MKRRLLLILRNPLIVVPPLVLVLGLGWQQYTYAGRDLSLPSSAGNLLPNSDFSTFDANGIPTGWQLTSTGQLIYATNQTNGYANGTSLKVVVSNYQNGNVTLTSPKVAVQPGKTYLFKGYYTASQSFALLARYYHPDGTSTLELSKVWPDSLGDWTTASAAFQPTSDVTAVQLVYRMYANGNLTINSPYLEQQNDVYIAPEQHGTSLIPNSQLAAGAYDVPKQWATYHTGTNTAAFSYGHDQAGAYVQAQVSGYQDGQAKWQYPPRDVHGNQYYQITLTYRSDIQTPIIAEYVMQNGRRQDQAVAAPPPADDWTTATYRFETPPGATNMFISLPVEQNGTIASRDYQLLDVTRPGAGHWRQPIASISFDDGWKDAYQNADPLLRSYDYAATFFINPAAIETDAFMTASDLTQLSKDGNEIAAHGYEHDDLTAINDNALQYQLQKGRDYLQGAGFTVTDVAAPYGRTDAEVQWYARQYYSTLRTTESGLNTRQNIDPYNLKVLYITKETDSATIASALQAAKQYNGWVIFVYHQVSDNPPRRDIIHVEDSAITAGAFKKQLSQIHESGIKVLPIAAAYANLEQQ